MQTQIVVRDNVEGKFGLQLKDDKGFLSFGKFYSGEKSFPAGTVLQCELYITEKGSRYINKAEVVSSTQTASDVAPKRGRKPKEVVENQTYDANKAYSGLLPSKKEVKKEVDWDELGRGKTASLFVAALLQNPNVVQQIDGVDVDAMETLVWELVDVVFRTRKEKV